MQGNWFLGIPTGHFLLEATAVMAQKGVWKYITHILFIGASNGLLRCSTKQDPISLTRQSIHRTPNKHVSLLLKINFYHRAVSAVCGISMYLRVPCVHSYLFGQGVCTIHNTHRVLLVRLGSCKFRVIEIVFVVKNKKKKKSILYNLL